MKYDEPAEVAMPTGHRRVCLAALILALALAAQWGAAQSDPTTDLKALRTKYDQCLTGIQTNSEQALEKWPQSYVDELKKAQKKLQDNGSLDGVLAIRKEMERFDKDKQIPDGAVSDFAPLKELQLRWWKMPEVIEIEKSKRVAALSQGYMAALEEAKKKLTMQGKLDLAIEAKNEIDRVKTSAPVTAAEFALANAGARMASPPEKKTRPTVASPLQFSQLPANGLVLYYDFNRDEGSKVTDKSGKGNEGKVKGATWAADGKRNGGYSFDGNGYIDAGNKESLQIGGDGKSFTLGCWCKPDHRSPKSLAVLISQGGNLGGKDDALHMGYRPHLRFTMDFFSDTLETDSTYDDVGQWHHWMATYDAKERKQRLFRDGVKVAERTSKGDFIGKGVIFVGQWVNRLEKNVGFKGLIDEVMIWNRALSESEVKQVYALHGSRSQP